MRWRPKINYVFSVTTCCLPVICRSNFGVEGLCSPIVFPLAPAKTGGHGCSSTGPISGCVEGHIAYLPNLCWWRVPFIGWGSWAANGTAAGVCACGNDCHTGARRRFGFKWVAVGFRARVDETVGRCWRDTAHAVTARSSGIGVFQLPPTKDNQRIHLAFSAPKPPPRSTP
jgi:hypothetical protein